MFINDYMQELAYLRSLARRVSEAYPEIADLLSEREADPAVERLLQGAALLNARLAHRLDGQIPELVRPLLQSLWPAYQRPIPACTMVQFSGVGGALQRSHTIPKGVSIRSKRMADRYEGCEFQTCSPVKLYPLELTQTRFVQPMASRRELCLDFVITSGLSFDLIGLDQLRIYFGGHDQNRTTIYRALVLADWVSVRDPEGNLVHGMGPTAVRPIGLSAEEPLTPGSGDELLGLRLLESYFAFPDKFLGIEICGLERVPRSRIDEQFTLVFGLGSHHLERTEVHPGHFLLGCTPAVNLRSHMRVDIEAVPDRTEFEIPPPAGTDIFDVHRVGTYDRKAQAWRDFDPWIGDRNSRPSRSEPRYLLRSRVNTHGQPGLAVAIVDADGQAMPPATKRLSVWATFTDQAASALRVGDVCIGAASTPAFVNVRNITPVSPPQPALVDTGSPFELMALSFLPSESAFTTGGLRRVVERTMKTPSQRARRMIQDVRFSREQHLHRQALVPVQNIEVDLDETAFISPGQAYLFARILFHLLCGPPHVDTHLHTEVQFRTLPSKNTYRMTSW